jgi:ankyrin repeat protein
MTEKPRSLHDELIAAIYARDIEATKLAISRGANPFDEGGFRQTPLLGCAKLGFLEGAIYLLPLSDPQAVDENGWNALMASAASGHSDCCALLADESSARSLDIFGHDALMLSADARSLDCARILAPLCDPTRRNQYHASSCDIAIRQGAYDIAEFIQLATRVRHERQAIDTAVDSVGRPKSKHRI